jgi:hypothetical protein
MVDHGTHLKAVNHPVRKEMLKFINESEKISRADLLIKLKEQDVLNKEDMFDYNMNYLIQAECVKKQELDAGNVEYEILPAGKVIEKY